MSVQTGTATAQAQNRVGVESVSPRLYFLDNLRAFVILLVILLHTSMIYMAYAPEWWSVLDPKNSLGFTMLVLVIDVPIMPMMFFISGYFALGSLRRQGPRPFLRDKLVRIGLPWAFGVLFLAPMVVYMALISRNKAIPFLEFWRTRFWGDLYQQSVYWYLGILMLLFLGLVWVYEISLRVRSSEPAQNPPDRKAIAWFLGLTGAAFLLISMAFYVDAWSGNWLLIYQPVRSPLYIGYFALGVYAGHNRWFREGGFQPNVGSLWPIWALSGAAYLGLRLMAGATTDTSIWMRIGTAVLFNTFCFSSLLFAAQVFRQKANGAGRGWKSLASASYGIYYLHPLVMFPIAYLFTPLQIPIVVKAAVVLLLTAGVCWAVTTGVLKKLPGLKAIF
jgi:peptidoglycan/LPS O-acetylase OafA/YrhL